jgi:4-hydroxybutyrate CoA-transferase
LKIGVKYCGGCNPEYDRKKSFDKLYEELKDIYQFESVAVGIEYDIVLVLCGCARACIVQSNLKAKYSKLTLTNKNDYIYTVKLLKELSDKKKG